jgi:hypothetical protein
MEQTGNVDENKRQDAGFGIQGSGGESVLGNVSLPDADEDRQGHKVHRGSAVLRIAGTNRECH